MSVPIPTTIVKPPLFRVLYAPSWGAASGTGYKSTTSWTTLFQPDPTGSYGGYELGKVRQTAIPEIGQADFYFAYGKIPGSSNTPQNLLYNEVRLQLSGDGGTTWVTVFWGQVVSMQRIGTAGSSYPQGVMKYHVLEGFARTMKWPADYAGYDSGGGGNGAPRSIGPVRGNPGYNYQLASDGPVLGNKGTSTFTVDGTTVTCHAWQGAFATTGSDPSVQTTNKWFEAEMINHALSASKPTGEPLFHFAFNTNTSYYTVTPQPVYPNESVYDVVARITARQRGKGILYTSYTDNGDGSLSVVLLYSPLWKADISYVEPGLSGTSATIEGATTVGSVYQWNGGTTLDLIDNPFNMDEVFDYSSESMHQVDMVETVGERIEVAVTLSLYDGCTDTMTSGSGIYDDGYPYALTPRWSMADVTAFTALQWQQRVQPYWNFLYQSFGLPRDWTGLVGDGNNGAGVSGHGYTCADYRCNGDGSIRVPTRTPGGGVGQDPVDTPANMVELLGYLPFYEGYDYSGTYPKRTDSSTEYGLPQRRPALVMLHNSGWITDQTGAHYAGPTNDNYFLPGGQLPQVVEDARVNPTSLGDWFSPMMTVQPDGIVCVNTNAVQAGIRAVGDPVLSATLAGSYVLESILPVTRLVFTVGLRLPHRLRFASYLNSGVVTTVPTPATGSAETTWQSSRKRKIIYIENANLWLASPNCIWDLNGSSPTTDGYPAKRGALGSLYGTPTAQPAILRDDRPFAYRYHLIAAQWYLQPRNRLTFGMRFCGLLPFSWVNGGSVTTGQYPTLGDYIDTLSADGATGGSALPVGTVCTSIEYDHQSMSTVWQTDWFDLEGK